jgi:ActR/RegA family two-component response regulator
MTEHTTQPILRQRRLLLVDDYNGVLTTMELVLQQHGFEVTTAANVPDALRLVCSRDFEVLVCDLHMPRPGDGFTVISAMRHCHPEAVNILYSGFPALHAAMADILLQADEIVVKPIIIPKLIDLINQRLSKPRSERPRPVPGDNNESVARLLQREVIPTIADWLDHVKLSPEIMCVSLTDAARTAHLPQLFRDLNERLLDPQPLDAPIPVRFSAHLHGVRRRQQGYTAAMIVEESRILQVSIFKTLQNNLASLDFSNLLLGVMSIADEVDVQLRQAMDSYVEGDRDPERMVPAA